MRVRRRLSCIVNGFGCEGIIVVIRKTPLSKAPVPYCLNNINYSLN